MKIARLLLLAPVVFAFGCKDNSNNNNTNTNTPPPNPKICFTVNKTVFDSGETFSITNCSTNSSNYLWNFGEGIQSSTTDANPTHVYTTITRGLPGYHITGKAYNAEKTKESDSSVYVVMGYRQIDSVKVVGLPGFVAGTDLLFQWGPASNPSMYSAPDLTVNALPATFVFAPGTIRIDKTNNNSWGGHFFDKNKPSSPALYTFGTNKTYFVSRGVNASPIELTDAIGLKLEVYYSLVTK